MKLPPAQWIVGLTGGIGSGKSTVANLFAERGAKLVDTDVIAHQLTAPGGAAIDRIRAAFGAAVLTGDGALNRAEMRRRAFADPAVRGELEGILHPLIGSESLRQCALAAGEAAYVMLVVPLLVESGAFRQHLQRILVVDCPEAVQIDRVMARNGLGRPEVEAIMAAQISRADRLAVADDVILNEGTLAEVAARVEPLHRLYARLAAELKASC